MNVESSAPRTMQPSRPLANLMRLAGIDFHILQTLLQRSWAILAGGMTALLIPSFLSPLQQGYYFTFSAVLAAQIFFELGLNHVLVQLTSHAAAHLQRISKTDFDGDFRWRNAIISLLALSSKWNSLMASLFFTTMLLGGSWFFIETGTLPMSQWLTVWVLLVFAFAINLALSSRLAICEGLGEVGQVAQLRLGQSIIGYSILWLLLVYGAGLWAIVAVPLTNAVGTLWWLSQRRLSKSFGMRPANSTVDSSYSYVRDVFPLQWRIAISWVSGFFIFSFLTPVVFAKLGEIEAGKFGLGMTIFTAISTVGMSWISAKIPVFSGHIARQERSQLNSLFYIQATRAVGVTSLCSAIFLVVVQLGGHFAPMFLDRLPSMSSLFLLAMAAIGNCAIFALAAYMRAHQEEPMVLVSITSALLISSSVFLTAPVGMTAILAAYSGIILFVVLPWTLLLFLRYWRQD